MVCRDSISAHGHDKEGIRKSVCALNATWVCHYVSLGWLTPIPTLFPHSCPHSSAAVVAFRHHGLWNLAGSSAAPHYTTKQLPSPLGWRPGMTWVSPAGLVPLGIRVSPCQTPGLELHCWCGGLCQQDQHCTAWLQSARHWKEDKGNKRHAVSQKIQQTGESIHQRKRR